MVIRCIVTIFQNEKEKNISGEECEGDESFPVDTLGIPILVEVVEPAPAPETEERPESPAGNGEPDAGPVEPRSVPAQASSTELPEAFHLGQITDRIAKSVTEEILTALEPVVREKLSLALRMYEDELLNLPDEEGESDPDSD